MLVVMGASGRVGGAVLDALARSGIDVRAISRLARDEARSNVEWVVADAFDAASLATALEGAEAAFVLNSVSPVTTDIYREAAQLSDSVGQALTKAAVPYTVALSSQGAHLPAGTGVVGTLNGFERALSSTGREITFLRPAFFMESWVPLAQAAIETSYFPAFISPASKAIDAVSARDVGEIAAQHLMNPQSGIVSIAGPQRYSDEDAVSICAELSGRDIVAAPVPPSDVAAAHEAVGLSSCYATAVAEMYEAINGDRIPFEKVGRSVAGKTTLRDVLAAALR